MALDGKRPTSARWRLGTPDDDGTKKKKKKKKKKKEEEEEEEDERRRRWGFSVSDSHRQSQACETGLSHQPTVSFSIANVA